MKCIILAAGYATRLYPLTKDKPKPLLEVAGRPILEYILEKVKKVRNVEEIVIVTNERFYSNFCKWADAYASDILLTVVNDGTTTNDNRLGAVADIQYAIDKKMIHDDIMVLAGDNLFDFELTDFVDYFNRVNDNCITAHTLNNINQLRRTGVVDIDREGKVLSFEEKPENPKSNLAVPPFYIYKADTLPLISRFIAQGNNPDAPGNFIPWLIQYKDVYAYHFHGNRYDIGTLESYEEVQKLYEGRL